VTTILVVEDSEAQRQEIARVLAEAAVAERILGARRGLEGLRLIASERIDTVLCDLELPELDGEKLLRFLRAKAPNVPVLFLTASRDRERRVQLLSGGACDVIAKPFFPAELVARVRLHLKIKQMQDELEENGRRLAALSTTDELTGLGNRRLFERRLEMECERSRRHRGALAVTLFDVDRFKGINDRWGHPAGDAVLREIGRLLGARTRQTNLVSRYGGEEFACILVETAAAGAVTYAERLRQLVESSPFPLPGGGELRVTLSAGVAEWTPTRGAPAALVAAADAALYRAKALGRNRVELAG
jgi:diguanylate cyclase (GGDEF)-like protein